MTPVHLKAISITLLNFPNKYFFFHALTEIMFAWYSLLYLFSS